ncbi:MAG: host specificity factor TipJ family phage tail protein [Alcaligenes aquatilis]
MIVVNIVRNVLEPESITRHETDDLIALLRAEFGDHAPEGARLYHEHVSEYTDVTPTSKEAEDALHDMPGPFYLVIEPQGPEVWIPLAIAAVVSVASMLLFRPQIPNTAQRNIASESPNNGLSARANRERVNGRIPDIYGTVRSTPDLLAVPYSVFENHVEKEIAYMCVGRGQFEIHDVRDDTTPADEIAGMSVEVYGPNTSPNGGVPQLRIGNAINTPVLAVKRSNSVNGQVLQPPNSSRLVFSPMVFESPNIVRSTNPDVDFTELFLTGDVIEVTRAAVTAGVYQYVAPLDSVGAASEGFMEDSVGYLTLEGDQSENWEVGQTVTITNGTFHWIAVTGGDGGYLVDKSANINGTYDISGVSIVSNMGVTSTVLSLDISQNYSAWPGALGTVHTYPTGNPTLTRPSGEVLYDLSGTYTINTLTNNELSLSDPASVNADWNVLESEYGGISPELIVTVQAQKERWVGWMTVESATPISRAVCNIIALNGLYADNGQQQYRRDVAVRLEAVPLDAAGNPTASARVFDGVVQGSATSRSTRAATLNVDLGMESLKWQFRMIRTSDSDTNFEGQVIDEVKWRDLYAASPVNQPHFGDVTTVLASTFATDGALAVKERKLNLLVTRQIPLREGDGFTSTLHSTRNAADILCAIALDPRIGNRSMAEIDVEGIYSTAAEIVDYFGIPDAAEFCYTFDKSEMSFEETFQAVANAIFCQAYRQGSQLRLFFERETEDSSLLFNHRNTLPGSESRTFSFGPAEGYDGVEYEYVSPDDDAVVTIYLPDQSAVKPQKIESVGVRSHRQGDLHAWRAWNKIQHQHTTMERDCLSEASMLVLGQRILCSDTTKAGEQGGYVTAVDGLAVCLSQPMDWSQPGPHVMFIQNSDGQTEGIPISSAGEDFWALLSRPPRVPIVTSSAQPTGYIIGSGTEQRQAVPFIVTAKDPIDGFNVRLSAVNYDSRYYAKDGMYRK